MKPNISLPSQNSNKTNFPPCELFAYIHREGLARFCTEDYDCPTSGNKANDAIHLTNYSLNKHNQEYNFVNLEDVLKDSEGSKRTLESYWKGMLKIENGESLKRKVFSFDNFVVHEPDSWNDATYDPCFTSLHSCRYKILLSKKDRWDKLLSCGWSGYNNG